jgi:hypothetical protein
MSPAASVRAAEVVELDVLPAQVDVGVMIEHHRRLPGLLGVHHVLARLFRRDHLNVDLLHLRVAAAVVGMVVRIDDVLDRLVRQLLHLGDDVREVDLELVVDEHDALVRDERGRVAGHEVVVNHVEVVRQFHRVQLGRRLAELRVQVRHAERAGHRQRKRHTGRQGGFHGRKYILRKTPPNRRLRRLLRLQGS